LLAYGSAMPMRGKSTTCRTPAKKSAVYDRKRRSETCRGKYGPAAGKSETRRASAWPSHCEEVLSFPSNLVLNGDPAFCGVHPPYSAERGFFLMQD